MCVCACAGIGEEKGENEMMMVIMGIAQRCILCVSLCLYGLNAEAQKKGLGGGDRDDTKKNLEESGAVTDTFYSIPSQGHG